METDGKSLDPWRMRSSKAKAVAQPKQWQNHPVQRHPGSNPPNGKSHGRRSATVAAMAAMAEVEEKSGEDQGGHHTCKHVLQPSNIMQ